MKTLMKRFMTTIATVTTLLLATSAGVQDAAAAPKKTVAPQMARAVFAGGCFWCMEPPYEKLNGVKSVISGYTGGTSAAPTYEQVSAGQGGHYEAVEVLYDPTKVSYAKLLDVFWRNIDPTDASGQFCDKGSQYRSAVFFANESERSMAEATKAQLKKRFNVVTEILPKKQFFAAEDYHQDYYKKNPVRYKFYRASCGRDARLQKVWGKR